MSWYGRKKLWNIRGLTVFHSGRKDASDFLLAVAAKVKEGGSQTAYALAIIEAASHLVTTDPEASRRLLDEGKEIVEAQAFVEPVLSSSLYRTAAEYDKVWSAVARHVAKRTLLLD